MDEKLKTFIETQNPYLYILTPCYGSMCHVNYTTSLLSTANLLNQYNIRYEIAFCRNDSLISRARNNLVAKAMNNPQMTHILFIDSDITWKPVDVIRLLLDDKMIVGGIYPLKKVQWDRLKTNELWEQCQAKRAKYSYLQSVSDETLMSFLTCKYNFNVISEKVEVKNNLIPLRHLATGFMMIKRKTIEYMQEAFPSTHYTDDVGFLNPEENKHAYALFDCTVEDGHYFSEDWLFSQRWINMGGTVYANIGIDLTHTGIHDFQGSFQAYILGV
jgi:hypothetical protein